MDCKHKDNLFKKITDINGEECMIIKCLDCSEHFIKYFKKKKKILNKK